jgi:anthranilate phosphoribosyltransferase
MSALPDPAIHLSAVEAEMVFGRLLDEAQLPEQDIADFLLGLTERSETAEEIAGAARALRARLIPVAGPPDAVDVCGTGGDGHHTLNVSTAVSLVVAAAGVPVAKHGNRAASSRSGAADTLEALGLDMEAAGRSAERTLGELGICFLFAANHHPAMRRIQPIRKRIGRRTIFNLMGPLSNPAGVQQQLIGIARPAYVPIYAAAKAMLGTRHTMIVAGDEGLDELSLAGGNEVAEVRANSFEMRRLSAKVLSLNQAPVEAIRGGNPVHNAAALKALLNGTPGPYRDAVVFNAAAALHVAGRGSDWLEHRSIAEESIDSGRARKLLGNWIAMAAEATA